MVPGRDLDWQDTVAAATPHGCVTVKATDPLYILYTSGTTGEPKGVVRDNGGYCVALAWTMKNLYGVEARRDLVVRLGCGLGRGPQLHRLRTAAARRHQHPLRGQAGRYADAGAFWRVIAEHKAVALFTAPTAFRAIKKEDPDGKLLKQYDLSRFRTLFLAGERGDPPTIEWAQRLLGVPIVDHWWQTETGWAICGQFVGLDPMPVQAGLDIAPSPGLGRWTCWTTRASR